MRIVGRLLSVTSRPTEAFLVNMNYLMSQLKNKRILNNTILMIGMVLNTTIILMQRTQLFSGTSLQDNYVKEILTDNQVLLKHRAKFYKNTLDFLALPDDIVIFP